MNRRARGALGGSVSKKTVETEMGVDVKVTEVATGHTLVAGSASSSVKHGSAFSMGGIQEAEASNDALADVQA